MKAQRPAAISRHCLGSAVSYRHDRGATSATTNATTTLSFQFPIERFVPQFVGERFGLDVVRRFNPGHVVLRAGESANDREDES
jgi:hypothetical protein